MSMTQSYLWPIVDVKPHTISISKYFFKEGKNSKPEACAVKFFMVVINSELFVTISHFSLKAPAFPANIRLGRTWLTVSDKHYSFSWHIINYGCKKIIVHTPERIFKIFLKTLLKILVIIGAQDRKNIKNTKIAWNIIK